VIMLVYWVVSPNISLNLNTKGFDTKASKPAPFSKSDLSLQDLSCTLETPADGKLGAVQLSKLSYKIISAGKSDVKKGKPIDVVVSGPPATNGAIDEQASSQLSDEGLASGGIIESEVRGFIMQGESWSTSSNFPSATDYPIARGTYKIIVDTKNKYGEASESNNDDSAECEGAVLKDCFETADIGSLRQLLPNTEIFCKSDCKQELPQATYNCGGCKNPLDIKTLVKPGLPDPICPPEVCGCACPDNSVVANPITTCEWKCTEWTACNKGKQTRICVEKNGCGKTDTKPAETQTCDKTATLNCVGQQPKLSCVTGPCRLGNLTKNCVNVDGCGKLIEPIVEACESTILPQVPPGQKCGVKLPDLAVRFSSINENSVMVVVRNWGTGPASSIEIKLTKLGTSVGTASIGKLDSGNSEIVKFENVADAQLVPLRVVVDPDDKIQESSESNNEAAINPK
ncbi:MAG TPA: CARDB domain-containing protein, partial [Methylophilaceae bacterium]|nr:CARDB domain-containing protein [Methylophilaceae bacterium]